MTAQALHFSIDGAYLTEFARTRVLEGRWDHAWATLMEGLDGMTAEIALRILKGDAKLTGRNNDVGLEDDDDTEYKAAFARMFSGVYVTSDGEYMEPYAVVTSWGIDDKKGAVDATDSDFLQETSNGQPRYEGEYKGVGVGAINKSGRSLFYANDPRNDVVRSVNAGEVGGGEVPGPAHVLFRRAKNYPIILAATAPLNDPQAAFDAYVAADRYLDVRGWTRSFGNRDDEFAGEPVAETKTLRSRMVDEAETRMAKLEEELNGYRVTIDKQAGDDWFDIEIEGRTLVVPNAPFMNWALNRTQGRHFAPEWKIVTRSGMKMINDDPYHTDYLIASYWKDTKERLGLGAMEGAVREALYGRMFDLQETMLSFKCGVLCGEGYADGKIVHLKPGDRLKAGEIGVIPNAGPDYVEAAFDAITHGTAIITEAGGAMAHLATVGREKNLRLVRVKDARTLYPEGRKVTVHCTGGFVSLAS